jgi:hypothetical protein
VAGISLAVFGNMLRSLFFSLMANAHGVQSLNRYHDPAGWSIPLFTGSGIALLMWALAEMELSLRPPGPDSAKSVS